MFISFSSTFLCLRDNIHVLIKSKIMTLPLTVNWTMLLLSDFLFVFLTPEHLYSPWSDTVALLMVYVFVSEARNIQPLYHSYVQPLEGCITHVRVTFSPANTELSEGSTVSVGTGIAVGRAMEVKQSTNNHPIILLNYLMYPDWPPRRYS